MSSLWTFILIWGVWLITPVLVDGFETLFILVTVLAHHKERRQARMPLHDEMLPRVSVIIPAHNEAEVIDRCIESVKAQSYPHELLDIIIVDDGSTDGTADAAERHADPAYESAGYVLRGDRIKAGPFEGKIIVIRNGHAGKAHALNAGVRDAAGEIIVNIDSDVVLAPRAIRAIAEHFVRHPDVDAATGNIEVDWDLLVRRDEHGQLLLDEEGNTIPRELSLIERFLVRSQFLEYLCAFDLGRRSQSIAGTMYSLAGACSAFRRSVFDDGHVYRNDTVSEDTLLTFDLHRAGKRISFVEDARVHLEPVIDWDGLYAQRLRWARGQLEVLGLHEDAIGNAKLGGFGSFAVPKMLVFDHTLAFPRLVWMPLILCFPLFGYSWRLVGIALATMYLFYLAMELIDSVIAYGISDRHTRSRIESSEWAVLGLPLYRFVVFHFRFSGFLATLTERQQWTVSGPLETAKGDARTLRLRSVEVLAGMLGTFSVAMFRIIRAAAATVLPVLLAAAIILDYVTESRRS